MKLLMIFLISLTNGSCAHGLPKSFPDIDLGYIYSGADIPLESQEVRFSNLKDPKNPEKKYVKTIPEAYKVMTISSEHYIETIDWIKGHCKE